MTRRPSENAEARYSSGLYGWLCEREERAAAAPGGLPWTPNEPGYPGYPERLAVARAGCALNICVGDLPAYARGGMSTDWVYRASIAPDNSITFSRDDGRLWAAENGL